MIIQKTRLSPRETLNFTSGVCSQADIFKVGSSYISFVVASETAKAALGVSEAEHVTGCGKSSRRNESLSLAKYELLERLLVERKSLTDGIPFTSIGVAVHTSPEAAMQNAENEMIERMALHKWWIEEVSASCTKNDSRYLVDLSHIFIGGRYIFAILGKEPLGNCFGAAASHSRFGAIRKAIHEYNQMQATIFEMEQKDGLHRRTEVNKFCFAPWETIVGLLEDRCNNNFRTLPAPSTIFEKIGLLNMDNETIYGYGCTSKEHIAYGIHDTSGENVPLPL